MSLMTPAQLTRAASAYRALIRAQRVTFKGDTFALQKAHDQTRLLFNQFIPSASSLNNPSLWKDNPRPDLTPSEIDEHISSAFEIATYLRKNVVQGVKTEDGNYALRFTEETERGDNSTIKAPTTREATPMRAADPANKGVRRRRRAASATQEVQGCCGGSNGGASVA